MINKIRQKVSDSFYVSDSLKTFDSKQNCYFKYPDNDADGEMLLLTCEVSNKLPQRVKSKFVVKITNICLNVNIQLGLWSFSTTSE